MVWAKKITRVLAIGLGYGLVPLAFGPDLLVYYATYEDAQSALLKRSYSAVVINPSGHVAEAQQLSARARQLQPEIRVIFSGRHVRPDPTLGGESLVAGNGRQFIRGLRTLLGC